MKGSLATGAAAIAFLAAAVGGCRARSTEHPPDGGRVPPPVVAAVGTTQARWLTRVDATPGSGRANLVLRPASLRGVIVVSTSASGFVGVGATDGKPLWRIAGESQPQAPFEHWGRVFLPGRCGGRRLEPAPHLGCLDLVEPGSGRRTETLVIPVPDAIGGAPTGGLLAALGDRLVYAANEKIAIVQLVDGPATETLLDRPPPRGDVPGPPTARAFAEVGGQRAALYGDGIAAWSADGKSGFLRFDEPLVLGAAGPVRAPGGPWVHTIDETLVASDPLRSRRVWTAAGRFLPLPGALSISPDGRGVVALRVYAGRVGRARVAMESGKVVEPEPSHTVEAAVVLAAELAPSGAAAMATANEVIAFADDGRPSWRWPLPTARDHHGEPPVLRMTPDAVYVLFGGRNLARLPTP